MLLSVGVLTCISSMILFNCYIQMHICYSVFTGVGLIVYSQLQDKMSNIYPLPLL